jgi:hypothetical protein
VLQIFKYLEVDPKYKMLTSTLKKSAAMLKTLVLSFCLVLVGSGQGFFMAFGVSTYSFRSFDESILGLLRMAVGDFDYSELQGAQPVLGPIMFWVYIFLVFFVLMSMFIALIAEAFEEAKDEHAANKAKSHLSSGKLKLLSTKRLLQEAKTRRELASKTFFRHDKEEPERGMGLVSDDFIRDLQPFDNAVEVFLQEIERQERIDKRKLAAANMGSLASQKKRRRSLVDMDRVSTYAIGEAVVEGQLGSWWDQSRVGRWLRSRLYWAEVQQKDKAGNVRNVADWFDEVEAKSKGIEYRAKENYTAKTTKELSYEAGDVIVIVKKETDKKNENGNVLKEGLWYGYRKADGAGSNRILRNHLTLEKLAHEHFNTHQPVDAGEDGALSDEENTSLCQSEDDDSEHEFVQAPDTIQLGGTSSREDGAGSSSDDDDILHGLAVIRQKRSKLAQGGARRRVETMFGNPTQAHTSGSATDRNLDEPTHDLDCQGSKSAPLPLALTAHAGVASSQIQDSMLQELMEATKRVDDLERKLHRTEQDLEDRELEIEHLRSARGEDSSSGGYGSGGTWSSEHSRKIDEVHELLTAKQKFEDKIWTAKGGMARAILEDHGKTNKIETTLRAVVRKLEAMEAAGGSTSAAVGSALLPGAVAEPWSAIENGSGGAPQNSLVGTPSTRLRRAEHKEEAAIEWQRRNGALRTG